MIRRASSARASARQADGRSASGVAVLPADRFVFGLITALIAVFAVPAVSSDAAQPIVVGTVQAGSCSLLAESDGNSATLRLRVKPESGHCAVDEAPTLALLGSALSKRAEAAGRYTSVSIGRAVDYPWISRFLASHAARDPAWSSKLGRPVDGDVNGYVARALAGGDLTTGLRRTLADADYALAGVTVEKVLVGPVEGLRGRLPFDAQVWFRIERR